ncbi:penicillin binding protein PBP4B [Microbulbifer sediminum]|uniref:penicillin binding protein PBP4B n=1 Tax=Microbulbifer sediminum TaxID=2904250 RepID=UPI001F1E9066|nr:penicillin binding protein PBP4B [Microbulbifer sediminum]
MHLPRHTATPLAALMLAALLAFPATGSEATCDFPTLKRAATPEAAGFAAAGLTGVDKLIEADVAAGFPGAALVVIRDGRIAKQSFYGYRKKFDGHRPLDTLQEVRADTMFDLASNTKMFATNFALQKLVSEGRLDLEAPVSRYVPEFVDRAGEPVPGKAGLRVVDLLHHAAGFAPDPQYHNPAVSGALYSQQREKTLRFIPRSPLRYKPGTRATYSDTDYMLLGLIIERITGIPLDTYVEENIYRPLGLQRTAFNPLAKGFAPDDFAATELLGNSRDGTIQFPNIRTHTLQGEVHDEKAFYSMAGVSGHAGLFSTAGELAVLVQVMLNGGGYGDNCLFDDSVIARFTAPSPLDRTFGLGWRRNGNERMSWMFGTGASPRAYGHTGWTGTLTVIDPKYNLGIVLLTNKKHSRLPDPHGNPNRFAGDRFTTGKYGGVVEAIYRALLPDAPQGSR